VPALACGADGGTDVLLASLAPYKTACRGVSTAKRFVISHLFISGDMTEARVNFH
jgi:hypothetical protein